MWILTVKANSNKRSLLKKKRLRTDSSFLFPKFYNN